MMDVLRGPAKLLFVLSFALLSCGGKALQTPEDLPITEYAAGDVDLTLIMTTCSDVCSEYEPAECETRVEDGVITVNVTVAYADKEGVDRSNTSVCVLQCGPRILAHCRVTGLAAGTYLVRSGQGFERNIIVR